MSDAPPVNVFDLVGGEEFFTRLVDHFYAGVTADPVLRPLYPSEDLAGANERLRLFLMQYWGGPTTYSDTRGHPRLRMRHAPFPVGPDTQAAWLGHMTAAIEATGPPEPARQMMLDCFRSAVEHLRNVR